MVSLSPGQLAEIAFRPADPFKIPEPFSQYIASIFNQISSPHEVAQKVAEGQLLVTYEDRQENPPNIRQLEQVIEDLGVMGLSESACQIITDNLGNIASQVVFLFEERAISCAARLDPCGADLKGERVFKIKGDIAAPFGLWISSHGQEGRLDLVPDYLVGKIREDFIEAMAEAERTIPGLFDLAPASRALDPVNRW